MKVISWIPTLVGRACFSFGVGFLVMAIPKALEGVSEMSKFAYEKAASSAEVADLKKMVEALRYDLANKMNR